MEMVTQYLMIQVSQKRKLEHAKKLATSEIKRKIQQELRRELGMKWR
jgi:uncharacterized protein (UPF0212 family)